MKIERFDLMAYGPFTDHSLDFCADGGRLHVVFGNNEAGKSTCLRALTAWLFGFPARVPDTQLHEYGQLRVGGLLSTRDGEQLAFVRRKGNKDTLRDPATEDALPDEVLTPFLQGLDEPLFTRVYGIDHDRLVEGGRDILRQSGDLGQALFSAALGSAGLRALAERLENEAGELFLPRSPKRTINLALSEFKAANKAVSEAQLPVREYKHLQRDLQQTADAIARVEEDHRQHSHHLSMLRRVGRVLGAASERRELIGQRDAEGEILLLPPTLADERLHALEARRVAVEARARAELKLSRRRQELADLEVTAGFLEHRETIEAIQRQLGAVEKAIADRPRHDGKRRMLRNEAADALKRIRPDLTLETAEPLRLALNNRRWIDDLARQHDLLQQRAARADDDQRQLSQARAALAPMPGDEADLIDLDALRAATTDARRAGDLDSRLDAAQRSLADLRARADLELARLGRFQGSLTQLLVTAFPAPDAVDHFERAFERSEQERRDRRREVDEVVREQEQATLDLRLLLESRPVPSPAELAQARADRDAAWTRLRATLAHTGADSADLALAALPLLLDVERGIALSDHLADLLRTNAADVQRRAHLEERIARFDLRIKSLQDDAREATAEHDAQLAAWIAAWSPSTLTPDSPREMRPWLLQIDKLRARADALAEAERERDRLQTLVDGHARALAAALGDTSPPARVADGLARAELILETHADRAEARRLAAQQLRDLDVNERRLHDELDAIDAERTRWREAWGRALTDLHLGPDDPPAKALVVMDSLKDYFDKFDQSEELRRRIYGINVVQSTFDADVLAFLNLLGLDAGGHSTAEIAQRLVRDRDDALVTQARSDTLTNEIREIEDEAGEATLAIDAADARLAAMRERAHVDDNDALELALQRSAARRALIERLEAIDRELVRAGDGRTVAELLDEIGRVDPDTLEDERTRTTDQLAALQAERDQLRYQHKSLEERLHGLDGSARAAQASEEAQQQLATIVSASRDYLRLKLASAILAAQVEHYRQQNQAPVLRRASALFEQLTLGSFSGLRDELDDAGRPVLLGLRPADKEVRVEGMSDGTRDQLFLALRLATLEQHLGRSEPMPFVVDDILVTFDDLRTRACLDVLAELAQQTQVLLFTHHHRVIELARQMPAEAHVRTHSLTA